MGDACEEIKPNLVGDVRPMAGINDFVENVRENDVNVEERGEHKHEWLTYSRFEPLDERTGGRAIEFHGEVEFGRNLNWRPGNPGFPARWGSWL